MGGYPTGEAAKLLIKVFGFNFVEGFFCRGGFAAEKRFNYAAECLGDVFHCCPPFFLYLSSI